MNLIKVICVTAIVAVLAGYPWDSVAHGQTARLDFSSSPNPVGSGARALGMGGAFIGVADDATAASWNPGGLIQLQTPEISVVGQGGHRIEANEVTGHPQAGGDQSISRIRMNYASVVYPFNLWNRNMVVSVNLQHLYEFDREWDTRIIYPAQSLPFGTLTTQESISFQQEGSLSAIGLAYCIQIVPNLSFGITLNVWDDQLTDNNWQVRTTSIQTTRLTALGQSQIVSRTESDQVDDYHFKGINVQAGILWRATPNLQFGMVFKSPFSADLVHERTSSTPSDQLEPMAVEMTMPMAFGIGMAWRFSDRFTLSADIYRTHWQDLAITDTAGRDISPITQKPVAESDIDPTHQVRAGMEYLIISPESDYVVPLRAGIFYDPSPAQGSSDDYFGFSLGSGLSVGNIVFDMAYQLRYGNDVNAVGVELVDFHQDITEHLIYMSLIVHL